MICFMKDDVITYIACVLTLLSNSSSDVPELSGSNPSGGVFGYDRDPSS